MFLLTLKTLYRVWNLMSSEEEGQQWSRVSACPAAFPSRLLQGKKLTGQSVLLCHFSRNYPHTSKHKACLASSKGRAS